MSSLRCRSVGKILQSIGLSLVLSHNLLAFAPAGTATGGSIGPGTTKGSDVAIEINGQVITDIGRGPCKEPNKKAKLLLNDATIRAHDDVRLVRVQTNKTNPLATTCPGNIAGQNPQHVVNIDTKDLLFEQKALLTPGQCSKEGSTGANLFCVYSGDSGEGELLGQVLIKYETTVTAITGIDKRIAARGAIGFDVEYTGTIKNVEVCYGEEPAQGGTAIEGDGDCKAPYKHELQEPPRIRIKGLKNETNYVVKIRGIDGGGAVGEWSKTYSFKPIQIFLPEDVYDGKGGQLSCQSSNAGSVFFLLFALVLIMLMRKSLSSHSTKFLSVLLLATLLMPSKSSHAEFGQLSFGLLGSMYRPDLDSEKVGDKTIFPFYKSFFKKEDALEGPIVPFFGIETDLHLFDGYGSLQLGLGLGYSYITGHGLKAGTDGKVDTTASYDEVETRLHMYQIRPQLTYYFDYAKEYFPFFPYIRGALIGHGYSFRSDTDEEGDKPPMDRTGWRFGWQAAVGLMFMMDFLEPGVVRSARGAGFLDHVYLKAELSYTKIDSFGSEGFQFSPKDVMGTSMPLMWTFGLVFDLP